MVRSSVTSQLSNTIREWVKVLAVACVCLAGDFAHAVNIDVVGLFKDKAVLVIDGTRRVLTIADVSPEGVKLLAVESSYAVLEIAGKRAIHQLGQSGSVSSTFSSVPVTEVRIARDQIGMFHSQGSINGTAVRFLIDTGATSVALNGTQARRLGIDFKTQGKRVPIVTASGNTVGYVVTLDRVKVGGIELFGVEGVVLDGSEPREALLGMSFLGRLEMLNEGGLLRLRKK